MIVGSLLLILVAGTLLVLGLAIGSSVLLVSSIASSLLAAVALVVGARQAMAGRAGRADEAPVRPAGEADDRPRSTAGSAATDSSHRGAGKGRSDGIGADVPVGTTVPRQGAYGSSGGEAGRWEPGDRSTPPATDDEPAPDAGDVLTDEPAAQAVAPAEAAKVARLLSDVLVIDGRPRYHLPGCDHLRGRESEPLPVSEAIELGFTPCARCEPNSALLADAR